ncbi:unannotated protein [freshwater metagenome]|uniref:Unannotated protein n=1 Tax=freshwater metagenome TaxID=449393 RepID=A0A6J7C5F7_9ZZZZ
MRVDVVEHIVTGDTPTRALAGEDVGIDAMLGHQSTNDRRQQTVVLRLLHDRGLHDRSRGLHDRSRGLHDRSRGFHDRSRSRSGIGRADHRDDCTHGHGLTLGGTNFDHDASDGRGHLGVHLVGAHLEQGLVGGDSVADLLEPAGDRTLGDGFAQLRQGDIGHLGAPLYAFRLRPVSDSTVSPKSSVRLGWGWMNSATSAAVASQLTAR